jgi:alkanesulfonate monooxygenase SsuD/methylene tetrahydromethanopterin reductase-like flavin-dependent oxidoreductase (luciferase family)
VEYGAHLPLADLGEGFSLATLRDYARAASELGYSWLCANDHLVFPRPWLDGLAALSAVIDQSGDMTLATTVSLPVIRGPAALAKALTAIDILSGGRLIAGVGPGSSKADYELVGIPFDDRWRRFDETLVAMRALLGRPTEDSATETGRTDGPRLEPHSSHEGGTPVWVASWGSGPGLRRVARRGDGWIASAYNVSSDRFRDCLSTLRQFQTPRRTTTAPRAGHDVDLRQRGRSRGRADAHRRPRPAAEPFGRVATAPADRNCRDLRPTPQ